MSNIKEKLKKLSNSPGVYMFKNKAGGVIYVGKSGNLKNRVRSYFGERNEFNAAKKKMLTEITDVEILKTESEIEALIKESGLIKKLKPKFNVLMRDSKNYLYVEFTSDEFPKIVLTHQPSGQKSIVKSQKFIGPFTDSTAVKKTIHILRDIFPYCTCKQKHNIKCLNAHMGKCLGICCLKNVSQKEISEALKTYKKNIRSIKAILSGKSRTVLNELKKEIKIQIKLQNFERAQELKKQIHGLESVLAHTKVLTDFVPTPSIFKDTTPDFRLLGFSANPERIETYDISNIQGNESVGSMVVFDLQDDGNYKPNKNEYRKFKIKYVSGINDTAMIAEVISRRLKNDWPVPNLIVVDGGRGQLNSAIKAVGNKKINVISLAKRLEEIYLPNRKNPILAQSLGQSIKHLFQSMRDEAHRFAIGYHRKLRRKSLANQD